MTYHGRVRVAWALALLVGCYGPSVAPGAPCDPAIGNCPSGQTCQLDGAESHCLPPGTASDAAIDGVDAPDAPHTLVAIRSDNNYACVHLGGMTAAGPSGTMVANPTIGLRSESATARFQWLLIVKMP